MMILSGKAFLGALAFVSVAAADVQQNYNKDCYTASDVDSNGVYSYAPDDLQDFGFYTQARGTCDAGSSAQVHVYGPDNTEYQCGYLALDGKLNLVSCPNLPRGSMAAGTWTVYWETTPTQNGYSWNSFTVQHTQVTITNAGVTSTITSTPSTVITSTISATSVNTAYIPQVTVTSPSATQVNTKMVTLPDTTITTTSTSTVSITNLKYALATVTAYSTAACTKGLITPDLRGSGKKTQGVKPITRQTLFEWLANLHLLRARGDIPNSVGMPGQPLTKTITADAAIVTVTASTTVTSTLTITDNANGGTVTVTNPTPTVTAYSGVDVSSTTITVPQVTKSVVKNKLAVAYVTVTSTLTYTKKVVTTPVCAPSPL